MSKAESVVWETPGVTVSNTTEEERKAEARNAPRAELQGALKVVRALSERVVEPMNHLYLRLQVLERRVRDSIRSGRPVDNETAGQLVHISEGMSAVCDHLRKFQQVETLYARDTPVGQVLALEESAANGDGTKE